MNILKNFITVNLLGLLIIFVASGCIFQPLNVQPTNQPYETCIEEKKIKNKHISMINEFRGDSNFSIENTKELIRFLSDNFNIDSNGCVGFTESVKSAAKYLFSTKRHLFVNPLREICSQDVSLDSHNLVASSAQISEIKTSTFILKDIILVDTNSCTEIP